MSYPQEVSQLAIEFIARSIVFVEQGGREDGDSRMATAYYSERIYSVTVVLLDLAFWQVF